MNAQDHLARTRAALEALDPEAIDQAGMALVHALDRGGMIYTCGNGGSAAEALHLVEEVIGCYSNRARPARAAVCLNADPTTMTCIANEFGYENIFSRQLEALLRQEDILIVLSTSGESRNIINALQVARHTGAQTIGLLGPWRIGRRTVRYVLAGSGRPNRRHPGSTPRHGALFVCRH